MWGGGGGGVEGIIIESRWREGGRGRNSIYVYVETVAGMWRWSLVWRVEERVIVVQIGGLYTLFVVDPYAPITELPRHLVLG